MGKFVCTKRSNGEYQFNLNASNGQTILTSEGYKAKAGCANGIESVKKNATDDSKYERKTASNGKAYFVLKATNGQVIGTSQMYADTAACEKGIASVKSNAPGAKVEEIA
jgi:uncharacterized protein YegP (UPF0339 family)